eukprot:jgi/Mesen1/10802/ME000092S10288
MTDGGVEQLKLAALIEGMAGIRFDSLNQFPDEILLQIFSHLPAPDLLRACCVSRSWQTLASADCLWIRACYSRFHVWEDVLPRIAEALQERARAAAAAAAAAAANKHAAVVDRAVAAVQPAAARAAADDAAGEVDIAHDDDHADDGGGGGGGGSEPSAPAPAPASTSAGRSEGKVPRQEGSWQLLGQVAALQEPLLPDRGGSEAAEGAGAAARETGAGSELQPARQQPTALGERLLLPDVGVGEAGGPADDGGA